MCTVAVAVPVVVDWWLMMALRRDLVIHQGDCGQAKSASSSASVVPSAHVKWLGWWKRGTCCRALGLKDDNSKGGLTWRRVNE